MLRIPRRWIINQMNLMRSLTMFIVFLEITLMMKVKTFEEIKEIAQRALQVNSP